MLYLAYQVGAVAQLVEQRTENPRVVSSILTGATKKTSILSRSFLFTKPRPWDGALLQKITESYGQPLYGRPRRFRPNVR